MRKSKSNKVVFRKSTRNNEQQPIAEEVGSGGSNTSKFRIKREMAAPTSQLLNEGNNCNSQETDDQIKSKVEELELDMCRRQESYIRRERQYKARIEELEEKISKLKSKKNKNFDPNSTMDDIRLMHSNIIKNVSQVQERTAKIMQEQEKDLLRAFRARLYDVQEELEVEKNKTDDGAAAWIEKAKQLEAEVNWTKEVADRLDRLNQSLTRENQRLKSQFTSQESDREFLVQQLVSVKKDNVRLRTEYETVLQQKEELKEDLSLKSSNKLSESTTALPRALGGFSHVNSFTNRPNTAVAPASANTIEADNRYKEIIKRLKRLLEVERKNLRQVRAAYTTDLQQRTELELFLRECIDDVKVQIIKSKKEMTRPVSIDEKSNLSLSGFTTADREKVIELLMSQERVVSLLYSKTFPVHPSADTKKLNQSSKNGSDSAVSNHEEVMKKYVDAGIMPPS